MNRKKLEMTDSFSFENCLLSYRFICEGESVVLVGEEFLDGESIFFKRLSFPLEDALKVRKFYKILLESRTFPRMMEELSEEFF